MFSLCFDYHWWMKDSNSNHYDAIVIGAGAAGMMCAAVAGQGGARVLMLDHATKIGEKIRISGGGRCNFTNTGVRPDCFVGENPHFARHALASYSAQDFIELIRRYRIGFHEKHKGQLFCDESAEQIIAMLRAECDLGNVVWRHPVKVKQVSQAAPEHELGARFLVLCEGAEFSAKNVVIASGGLSIPKIGASDFGYRIAKQFGLRLVEMRPALVPLTFAADQWAAYVPLAGLSVPTRMQASQAVGATRKAKSVPFDEDLLFTHRGLSGPGILQISSYWHANTPISLNLLPNLNMAEQLLALKQSSRKTLGNILAEFLPQRLAREWLSTCGFAADAERKLAELSDARLRDLGQGLNAWTIQPDGTEGYRKAEVTVGGVSTDELDQRSMQVRKHPGLYFIGEVVDVTGWLGGYNFQWAWASGFCSGQAISQTLS
jgi:predicted Rossmann fold flavoprotein